MESGRLAADSILQAFEDDDFSGEKLGSFRVALDKGVESVRKLIYAFYDPSFSFGEFNRRHPDQRAALIDVLAGDVFKDMSGLEEALATMSPPPVPLSELSSNGGGPQPLHPAKKARQT